MLNIAQLTMRIRASGNQKTVKRERKLGRGRGIAKEIGRGKVSEALVPRVRSTPRSIAEQPVRSMV